MFQDRENSVVRALSELQALEDARVEEEEKRARIIAKEKRRLQQEERRLQEEEQKKREAESARRRQVEKELKKRDDEAKRRITTLEAELNAIRIERESLRQGLFRHSETKTVKRSHWEYILALGLPAVALIGVILTFLFLKLQILNTSNPPVNLSTQKSSYPSGLSATRQSSPKTLVTGTEVPRVQPPPRAPKSTISIVSPKKNKSRVKAIRKRNPKQKNVRDNILDNFEQCGDDPMCEPLKNKK